MTVTPRTGSGAYIGFGEEETFATYAASTLWLPVQNDGLDAGPDNMEAKDIIPNQQILDAGQRTTGTMSAAGDVTNSFTPVGWETLLKHLLGHVAKTGSGPYVRTFTVDDLVGQSFTTTKTLPSIDGTLNPIAILGCKVNQLKVSWKDGEYVTAAASYIGVDVDVDVDVVEPSYLAGSKTPFVFKDAAVTIGGTPFPVRSGEWSFDNGVTADRFNGSAVSDEPLTSALRKYGVSFSSEFVSMDAFNAYLAGAVATVATTFTLGSATAVFSMHCMYDKNTPKLTDRGIILPTIPMTAVDQSSVSIVLTNAQSTP